MKVSVIGLGWFGAPLARALLSQGHGVIGTTRDQAKAQELTDGGIKCFTLMPPSPPVAELLQSDIVILNIPPFEGFLQWVTSWPWSLSTWVIFISSTSEKESLLQQEEWVRSFFPQWTILRFGGLYGEDRHPGKSLSGRKKIKERLWPVNLLHLEDAIGFTLAIIEKRIMGETITVVSDEHSNKEKYYTEYARKEGLPLPEFDRDDHSIRKAKDNSRAKEIYRFRK